MNPAHCELSKEAIEWLNGELLGDGCLYPTSSRSASFRYGSKYLEYIHYVSTTLTNFGINRAGKIYERRCKTYNNIVFHYQSCAYIELLLLGEAWYSNGKKNVPRGLVLTPLVCRQWYIGDGTLLHHFNRKPCIRVSTDAFPVYDVEWLAEQLQELGFLATRQPSNNRIRIAACSTKDFLSYIGECPVKCYEYKWKYDKTI